MKKSLLTLMLFAVTTLGFTQTVETFTTPGSTTWLCPAGVTSIKVECWGGGGGGGGVNGTSRAGGGGGGGSYVVNNTVAVTPGVTYNLVVGAGGTAGTSGAATAFGRPGGFSRFTGDAITVTASGGTGGVGGTSATSYGKGGVLGGLYGFTNIVGGNPIYTTATTTFVLTGGGGGSGAVITMSTAGGTPNSFIGNIVPTDMGTGYTSAPTLTINTTNTGTGASATALVNPDINSGGDITLGVNGSDGTSTSSGAGGAGAMGGAGGASVPAPSPAAAVAGISGAAPGGGGSGAITNIVGGSMAGSVGASGQVKLTYIVTLPVSLTSFSAKKQTSGVQLKWNTSSEQNNSHFDVQRSEDGINFYNIGKVSGAGNSNSSLNYSYFDKSPLFGTNYYRLSQVDFNGNTTTYDSNIEVVNLGSETTLSIYPNPTSGTINISGLTNGDIVKLVDLTGKVIKVGQSNGSTISLNIEKADAGIYSLSVLRNGKMISSNKIIKN